MSPRTVHRDSGFEPGRELLDGESPAGADRRAFLMRSAVVGAAAVIVTFRRCPWASPWRSG